MRDRPLALIFPAPNSTTLFSIMPKDPTEKREKKEKKEKREKRKKEVVEEAPAEAPTTDVPDDVEMDDNVEETKVYFSRSRLDLVSTDRSYARQQQVTKKPKREKKEKQGEVVVPVEDLSPIAHPLAHRKLLRKLNKTVKKGMDSFVFSLAADRCGCSSFESPPGETRCEGGCERYQEGRERVGTRSIQSSLPTINRSSFSILILAGDITPIDIISHLPVMCEDAQIPYVFVPSKEELGHASATKRPTSCVMVCPNLKKKPKAKDGKASDATKDLPDDEFKELYTECFREVQSLDQKILY